MELNKLVFIEKGRIVTDSLRVAYGSNKHHKNVLRDIRNIKCSDEFNKLNFEPIEYRDDRGRKQTKYHMTEEGFTFLVMGWSGEQTAEFKEKYIREFARMAGTLNQAEPVTMHSLLQTVNALMNSQQLLLEQVSDIEERLEQQITLNSREQRILQQAITSRVHSLETSKAARRLVFRQLHRDIRDRWEVSSYKDVLRLNLKEALVRIAEWVPIRELES